MPSSLCAAGIAALSLRERETRRIYEPTLLSQRERGRG
jgi:hypothetical protein